MNKTAAPHAERFGRAIERSDGRDFPFYNFIPAEVPTSKWLVILASTVVVFLLLMVWAPESQVALLAPRILFTAIPFSTFVLIVRPNWRSIFKPIGLRDVGTIVLFWLINLGVAVLVSIPVRIIVGANSDAVIDEIADLNTIDTIAFFVGTGIQIFGEELFSILPFLALMYWFHKAGLSRNRATVFAWIITAVWFGLAHLPAYGWNIVQVLLVIGVSRIILTLAYIRTKNIIVSTGTHLLHDWSAFAILIATGVSVGAVF